MRNSKYIYLRGNKAQAQIKAMTTLTEFLKISRKMQTLSYQYTHCETRAQFRMSTRIRARWDDPFYLQNKAFQALQLPRRSELVKSHNGGFARR
jgi:hypothetical protein